MKTFSIFESRRVVPKQKVFRLMVLEDSELFNEALTRKLEQYAAILAIERNCWFEIQAYASPDDFIRNLRNDTDIVFVDYYLGNGITGSDIVKKIRERCWDCKVVIISQAKNISKISGFRGNQDIEFLFKNAQVLAKCCYILEEFLNSWVPPRIISPVNNAFSPFNKTFLPKM